MVTGFLAQGTNCNKVSKQSASNTAWQQWSTGVYQFHPSVKEYSTLFSDSSDSCWTALAQFYPVKTVQIKQQPGCAKFKHISCVHRNNFKQTVQMMDLQIWYRKILLCKTGDACKEQDKGRQDKKVMQSMSTGVSKKQSRLYPKRADVIKCSDTCKKCRWHPL